MGDVYILSYTVQHSEREKAGRISSRFFAAVVRHSSFFVERGTYNQGQSVRRRESVDSRLY